MKVSKLLFLGMLIAVLCVASSASAQEIQFHGATIAKFTVSPKEPGQTLDATIEVGYNDDFGDTLQINECWDIVDPGGHATRIPATGNLPIVAVIGNTTATVGGSLPVLIGPAGSTENGLPGIGVAGAVQFGQSTYVVQNTDPNPLPDQANALIQDLCDVEPEGCSDIDNLLQFPAATNIVYPEPCVEVTKEVDCLTSKAGDTVTYHYCIHNCGPLPLEIIDATDSVVTDAVVGAALIAAGCVTLEPDDEAPGGPDECCFDVDYVIQPGDPNPLVNEFAVLALDTTFQQETPSNIATATVDLVDPSLIVTKSCINENQQVEPGGIAIFEVGLENDGDVCLEVDIIDPVADRINCTHYTLQPGDTATCQVEIDVPAGTTAVEIWNDVTAHWTICVPPRSEDPPCLQNEGDVAARAKCDIPGGAARTPGFWKTHTALADHVLSEHVPGCGDTEDFPGCIDLGWIKVCDIEEFCAVMWANKSNNSDGSKRDKLCKARMHAAFQILPGVLNNCMPGGASMPATVEAIRDTQGGEDIVAIRTQGNEFGAVNESGEDVMFNDPDAPWGSATPQECKAYDQEFADCIINGLTATGKGKGPK